MKKDVKEIAVKSDKELKESLLAKREELVKIRMDANLNKIKNTRSIFHTRKEIARILTLIREKELAAEADQNK